MRSEKTRKKGLMTMAEKEVSATKLITPISIFTLVVPIVAFAAAMLSGNTLFLNYLHVLTGATWTGVDLFMGLVMGRVLGGLEPPARVQIIKRLVPIMLFFMPAIASVTITAGFYLAIWEGVFSFQSPLIIAAIAITAALTVQGIGMILPNELRIYLELRKESPNNEKIVKLGLRNFKLAGSEVIFQIAIIFVMANLAFLP